MWAILMIGSGVFAQSLSLKYEDEDVSNDTVYLSGEMGDDLIEWHAKVKNLTDKEIDVKVRKTEISIVENTVNTFCWGSCFMPTVFVSPVSIKINAFATDFSSFAGDFEPSGMEGTSIISYTFFNAQNEDDSVMVTAFYQVGTSGIPDFGLTKNTVKVFPNPMLDQLNVQLSSSLENPYSIRLLNLNGQVLEELVENSRANQHSFSLPNLSAGYAILEISDSYGLNYRRKILIGK